MHCGIGDNSDACRPGCKRNQPDPVTVAHQVIRAEPSRVLADIFAIELRVPRPIVDADLTAEAKPGRARMVIRWRFEIKLFLQQARAAGSVDNPPGSNSLF